jgi:hypothetical protein
MKSSLACIVLLLGAASAQAQQSHHHSAGMESSQNYLSNGSAGIGGSEIRASGRHAVRYEPSRNFVVGYAKNDGAFEPSTYMNYDDALALGRRQLAEEQEAAKGNTPSLGDVARAYRAIRVAPIKSQDQAIQDNSGRIVLCDQSGRACSHL